MKPLTPFDDPIRIHNRNWVTCKKHLPYYVGLLHVVGSHPEGIMAIELFKEFEKYCKNHKIKQPYKNFRSLLPVMDKMSDCGAFSSEKSIRAIQSKTKNNVSFVNHSHCFKWVPNALLITLTESGLLEQYVWGCLKQKYNLKDRPVYANKEDFVSEKNRQEK